jgi:hypothetical protein
MSEAILNPTLTSDATDGLAADALRAENGPESPSFTPARIRVKRAGPGTARRAAFDEALPRSRPGARHLRLAGKFASGFLLGLERVLSMKPPATAAGTELRKHQIDALAGMLTDADRGQPRYAEDENGNGNGDAELEPEEGEERTRRSMTR